MIYVTGDTHGEERRFDECIPRYLNIGDGDTIIVAGDFGMIWNNDPNFTDDYNFSISDNERLDMIASKPFKTLFVDGNHENHPKIATFTVISEDGKEIECEILFTYHDDEREKDYIAYTDNTLDDEGNIKVFASIFNPDEDDPELLPIETDEGWNMIEKALNAVINDIDE